LPLFVPTAVNLEEGTRIPTVKWKELYQRIHGDEQIVWMQKLEEAVVRGSHVQIRGGCIQVRLGVRSANLCVLDVDCDNLVEPLLLANPILRSTLQTFGSKGRHIWFYCEGEYPKKKKLFVRGEDEKIEFLTEGSLCTVWGTHYLTGELYQIIHKARPISFDFKNLVLPVGCVEKLPPPKPPRPARPARSSAQHSGIGRSRKIDWDAYDTARVEDSALVEMLVEEHFPGAHWVDDHWQCADVEGGEGHSFHINDEGLCYEHESEEGSSIMQAITSAERDPGISYQEVFRWLAEQGDEYNFFIPAKKEGLTLTPRLLPRYNLSPLTRRF
jgi:hypothetical protein